MGEMGGNVCTHPREQRASYKGAEQRFKHREWRPRPTIARDIVEREGQIIAGRSEDVYRNCAMIEAGIQNHVDNAIGSGDRWTLKPEPDGEAIGLDAADTAELVRRIKKLWNRHNRSHRKWFDVEGKRNAGQLARLFARTYLWRGDAVALLPWVNSDNAPFRSRVKIIDAGRVANELKVPNSKNPNVIGGVDHTDSGFARGYYIHDRAPNAESAAAMLYRSKKSQVRYVRRRNALGRDQVVHVHRDHVAELARGVSSLVGCLSEVKCLERYTEATLEAAILQTIVALTIESDYDDALGVFGEGENGQQVSGTMGYMQESSGYHAEMAALGADLSFDERVKAVRLWNKEKLNMQSPDQPVAQYGPFVQQIHQGIARCLGHTYATYTQDWSKTNFSGGRAGLMALNRFVESFRFDAPEHLSLCQYGSWLEDVITSGQLEVPNMDTVQASLSFYVDRDAWSIGRFRGPAREEIDRAKQSAAFLTEDKLGAFTLDRYCDTVIGDDWQNVVTQQCIEEEFINAERARCKLAPLPPRDPRGSAINTETEALADSLAKLNALTDADDQNIADQNTVPVE
jgi:lambda family phage portal protein